MLAKGKIKLGFVLKLLLFALFALHIYSYFKAPWVAEISEWSRIILLSKFAYSNALLEVVKFGILLLVTALILLNVKLKVGDWVFVILFASFCAIYSVEAILDVGVSTALYSGNLPAVYLLLLAFFLGRSEEMWKDISGIIPIFLLMYVIFFGFEFFTSFSEYGWVIYQNSSLMSYYSNIFALSLVYIYTTIENDRKKFWLYLLLILLVIGGVVLRSRAWTIQSVLVVLLTLFGIYRKKNKSVGGFFKMFIVLAVIAVIALVLLGRYFMPFIESLIDKGTNDSRSMQYIELLTQVEPYKWIFGQGMNATYRSEMYGEYSYIDNELFYMSFHYGIIFAVIYFIPYLRAIAASFRGRKSNVLWILAAFLILIWLLSVNGLSVFNRIHLDIKSFIMPLFAGYLYQGFLNGDKEKEGNNEDIIHS